MRRKFLVQVMGVLLAAGMTAGSYATAMAAETKRKKLQLKRLMTAPQRMVKRKSMSRSWYLFPAGILQ